MQGSTQGTAVRSSPELQTGAHSRPKGKGLLFLAAAFLGAVAWTPSVAGQTLSVKIVDPFSDAVVNASVVIGDQDVPTDDSGVAAFSGLGAGPHSLVVIAPRLRDRGPRGGPVRGICHDLVAASGRQRGDRRGSQRRHSIPRRSASRIHGPGRVGPGGEAAEHWANRDRSRASDAIAFLQLLQLDDQ